MIFCQEIQDKQLWDGFVISQPKHTFLHSWSWGEFNEAMGDRVWRIGIYDGDNLAGVCLVIKVHAKRGNFLFVPQGPVLASGEKIFNFSFDPELRTEGQFSIFKHLTEKLKKIAKQEKVSFIRISPLLEDTEENKKLFKGLGFRPAPIHMHAETTWTLDLSPSENELLMGMRKTTRNLIRRAMKEGVQVTIGSSERDVEIFNTLYQETVKKHNFTPFSLTFLNNQVRIMTETEMAGQKTPCQVFTAYHQGKPLASAIVVFYGNSAFYHHGASVPSKIPAPYLLQWEAIREARRRGHRFYNFWGIVKENTPENHPWQGITLFKKGFGGFQTNYMHAQDLALSPLYWFNWLVETVRRQKRNL